MTEGHPIHDARSPRPHGRLAHWLVGVSATLSLMIAAGSVYGFVAYRACRLGTARYGASLRTGPLASPGDEPDSPGGPVLRSICNYLLLGSDSRVGLSEEEQRDVRIRPADRRREPGGHDHARAHRPHTGEGDHRLVSTRSVGRDTRARDEDKINAPSRAGRWGGGPGTVAKTVQSADGTEGRSLALCRSGRVPERDGHARWGGHVYLCRECQHAWVRRGRDGRWDIGRSTTRSRATSPIQGQGLREAGLPDTSR